MATFMNKLTESKCAPLHRKIMCDDEKFLCFTKCYASELLVGVTDGVTLWKYDLDEEEADNIRDLAAITTIEAFLTRIRNGFTGGDLSVAVVGNKVTLNIGKGSSQFGIDLYEAKAAEKKTELQTLLFHLADSATTLSSELDKTKQLVDTLKSQKGDGAGNAFMNLGPKKAANPAKAKPNKVGMSVLNPGSKKRKAAQGVVFD